MDFEQIDEIFAQALTGDYEDEAPWNAVRKLQDIGTREILERASTWATSDDSLKRARCADILGQLGSTAERPGNKFPGECFSIVAPLVQREKVPLPLISAIQALGHIRDSLAVPIVIEHRLHSDPNVRFAVACTLGSFADDPRVVAPLLELMQDADDDVRDWATFGLGVQGKLNTQEIRDALCQRIDDSDVDVREEALMGLSKRKDQRALLTILAELNKPEVSYRVIEAADAFLNDQEQGQDRSPGDYVTALKRQYSL